MLYMPVSNYKFTGYVSKLILMVLNILFTNLSKKEETRKNIKRRKRIKH